MMKKGVKQKAVQRKKNAKSHAQRQGTEATNRRSQGGKYKVKKKLLKIGEEQKDKEK